MKANFIEKFSSQILDRGYDYFKQNLVHITSVEENLVKAKVLGTETYDVYAIINENEFIDGDCTCPYSQKGEYCKHLAALSFYLNSNNKHEISQHSRENEIKKVIKAIDSKELEKFLTDLIVNNDNIYDEFRLKFNTIISPLTIEEYKQKIYNTIIESAGRDGFIDYEESYNYSRGMHKITEEASILVDNKKYKLAFDIVTTILETIPNTDIDDSNGSTSEVAEDCIEVIERILEESNDNKLSKTILKYIFDELETDYLSNYGIEMYFILNIFLEKGKYIKEIEHELIKVLKLHKTKEYFWNEKNYIDILTEIYNKENKQTQIINLLKEYSNNERVCMKLIDEYLNRNQKSEAINLLKEKLKNDPRKVYAEKLSEIYLNENMIEEYKNILYKLLFDLNKYNIDVYKQIKTLYSKEEWLKEKNKIIDQIKGTKLDYRNTSDLLNIYIEEKMYDEIYEIVKTEDIDTIINYEPYLLPKYNKKLIKIYTNICLKFAASANNRKLYRRLAGYVSHIKKMKNNKQEYTKLIESLKEEFRNKPAMQDELSKII